MLEKMVGMLIKFVNQPFVAKFFEHFYLILSVMFFVLAFIINDSILSVLWLSLSFLYLINYAFGEFSELMGERDVEKNDNKIKRFVRMFFGSWVFLAILKLTIIVGGFVGKLIGKIFGVFWKMKVVFIILPILFFAYLFWVSELRSDCRMEEARKYCEWKGKDYEPEPNSLLSISNAGIFYCSQGRVVNIYTLTEMEFEFCNAKNPISILERIQND